MKAQEPERGRLIAPNGSFQVRPSRRLLFAQERAYIIDELGLQVQTLLGGLLDRPLLFFALVEGSF